METETEIINSLDRIEARIREIPSLESSIVRLEMALPMLTLAFIVMVA